MARLMFTNESTRNVFAARDFGEFNKLMFDTAMSAEKVSKKEANGKIREVMFEVIGLDENASKKEIRKAIRRNQIAVYEVIEELIPNLVKTGWQENPFFQKYVEYRNMDIGDTNEFYVADESILTVSELSGNHHDLIRQRLGEGTAFSVKTSWYGVKIYAEFEKFMAGNVDWATFVQKIYEAFDNKVNSMLYEAVMAAGDKVLPTDMFTLSIQMQAQNVDKIIQLVDDVSAVNGEEAVIMGTKVALSQLTKLQDVDWISDDMKVERNTLGRIGMWEGITLVEIPQAFAQNDLSKRMVDNKRLLVMPVGDNKFIKMYDEGDSQIKEVSDGITNMDKTIEYEYQQKMGVATVINKKFGQIKMTD